MAGNKHKGSSNKRPASSSSERKSRWESTSSAADNPPSKSARKTSSNAAGSGSDSKPINEPSSISNRTPKRASNPSPAHPKPTSDLVPGPGIVLPSLGPPPPPPPPPPTYGFHMLDRRTIVLADGSVRSYFALPPDYEEVIPPPRPPLEPMGRFMSVGGPELGRLQPVGPMSSDGFRDRDGPFGRPDGWRSEGLMLMKREFGEREAEEREREELARQRQHLLQYGNAGANTNLGIGTSSPFRRDDEYRSSKHMRIGGSFDTNVDVGLRVDVDPAVFKAFLHFVKVIFDDSNKRRNFLENGKHGPIQCLACGRSSKDFPDVHGLMMHTYNSDNADLRVDHLGLHKALCVLMGWNYLRPPDNSRAYQFLPADEAAANQDDLVMWPPMVIIHNTNTGKGKDGRMEGLGNKAMDSKLRDLGSLGGKSKSLYNRDGHLGITLVKFASDQSGLKEAMRLAEHFEKERHGRRDWAYAQSLATGRDDENNPSLVTVDERTGERRKILYGYLGTASDLDKVDIETRKKVVIESKRERLLPSK